MADKKITVRFWEVFDPKQDGEPLDSVLKRIRKLPLDQREKDFGDAGRLTLEHIEQDPDNEDLWYGDMCRVQVENLPGHMTKKGTEALTEDNLSHGISFCFDAKAGALALQFDISLREGRLLQYFTTFSKRSSYAPVPLLNKASLTMLGKREIKALNVTVSKVKQFGDMEAKETDFEAAIKSLGGTFDAPIVKLKVSTRTGTLDKNAVLSAIQKLLKINKQTQTVKKISAEVVGDEIPFDFLKQLLVEKGELHGLLPKHPAHNRTKRLEFLKATYAKHRKHVRTILGVAD